MVKEIISKANPQIKDALRLKLKKNRDNIFLIEGERFVIEAIRRRIKINTLFYVKEPSFLNKLNCECFKITNEIADALSSTINTSGVFAIIEYQAKDFVEPKGNFLVLDRISDPGNLGTLIRTALAFDFKDIYLYNCVDWRNDKVLRSTMGTIFDVNLIECSLEQMFQLKNKNLYVADMDGLDIEIIEKTYPIGLILGNEANGVLPEIKDNINNKVKIQMKNEVESLNVAVAGAILMSKLAN